MRIPKWPSVITLSLIVGLGISGCTTKANHPNTSTTYVSKSLTQTPQKDGTIVSKELVHVPGQNSDVNIYKIFYISQGVKVEEFVSTPKAQGKYPMVVNLHGGYPGPQPTITHANDSANVFVYTAQSLKNAPSTQITILPEYQGYLDSEGHVQDIENDTKDVENAITSVMTTGQVASNDIYLIGYSLGGGIAIKVAEERSDVKAVVAVSPFMGTDEIIKWLSLHPQVKTAAVEIARYEIAHWESIYGNYQTDPQGYKRVSIIDNISSLKAPILLLQGTGDETVIWQTVQDVATQMQKQGKPVKLVLYPGGQHGLEGQYLKESNAEIIQWFAKYGLQA